jgi:drug/metabolite transporter (DMT)-like permease
LMLSLAGLTWAGNHIAARAGAGHVPPLSMASIRWLIGAAILFPFVYHQLRSDWPLIRKHWKIMALLCVGGGAFFSGPQYTALQYTTAMNASIVNSFAPIVIAIAGAIIYREHLNLRQVLGISISLTGVVLIISRGQLGILLNLSFNIGDVFLIINMAVWGIYSAMLRSRPKIHPLTFTFVLALTAGLVLFPGFLLEHATGKVFQATWLTFYVMAYVSIFPSVLGYIWWNRGIETVGPARGGIFLHLVPVYGVILAILLLGEHLQLFHILGFVLIITGVWLTSRKQ